MHRALGRNAIECQIEMLTPTRERRVIRCLEVGAHQGQYGPQEALGLAQRQPEDQPQHQRGHDGHVRELPRSTRSTRRCRSPRIHRLGGEPQGHVAPPDERLLIFRPIPNVIFGLVLRMNLRLHPEIVGQERRPGQLIGDHDPRRVRAILHQRRAAPPPLRARGDAPERLPGVHVLESGTIDPFTDESTHLRSVRLAVPLRLFFVILGIVLR